MKAIFFDVDDTLYDQLCPFKQAFEKNFIFNDIPVESLYITSRKLSDEVFHLSESGQMDLQTMHIYRIKKALALFNKEISDKEAIAFQKDYQKFQGEIELFSDVVDTLNFCFEQEIVMGIITNGPMEHQKRKIQQLEIEKWIPKENIFISSEVELAKPDIRIFHLVETKLHLDKRQIYYVGDSFRNDIIGAKSAGWKAIWSNRRNHEKILGPIDADYIVTNQNKLLKIVHEIILQS